MIFYFSGTGNSKWIAEEIAKETGNELTDIAKKMKAGERIYKAAPEETIGFVFPVYAWAPPEMVWQFAKGVLAGKSNYTFAVCTCGAQAGNAIGVLSDIIDIDAGFSIEMPNNYVIGSKPDQQGEIAEKIRKAQEKLPRICSVIRSREQVMEVKKGAMSALKSTVVNKFFNKMARDPGKFQVDEDCDSCEICKGVCPIGSISFMTKKPSWGDECLQCLACINSCPHNAIHYGKGGKPWQYTFEKDARPLL